MDRIPKDRLEALKRLGKAYYEARDALEREYFDEKIDPATYEGAEQDGGVDMAAYKAALEEVLAYVEDPALSFDAHCPTPSEPHHIWTVEIFGGVVFDCRRRLRAVERYSEMKIVTGSAA
jgi:hypothetical protein